LLASGKFEEEVTRHLLLECAILSARNEDHIKLVYQWLVDGEVKSLSERVLEGVKISTKHKHLMVKRIYTSTELTLE